MLKIFLSTIAAFIAIAVMTILLHFIFPQMSIGALWIVSMVILFVVTLLRMRQ